jgi:hypothetical protein
MHDHRNHFDQNEHLFYFYLISNYCLLTVVVMLTVNKSKSTDYFGAILDPIHLANVKNRRQVIPRELKNGVFWDVTPRGSCKNRRFGGT